MDHVGSQCRGMIVADSDKNASQYEVELLFFFSTIEEKTWDILHEVSIELPLHVFQKPRMS